MQNKDMLLEAQVAKLAEDVKILEGRIVELTEQVRDIRKMMSDSLIKKAENGAFIY
jgi:hypothetical protein